MPVESDLFGIAYLDAESFRAAAELFGVGMSLRDYPDDVDGNAKLTRVLQAASRSVDAFCGRDFTDEEKTENHALDPVTWHFTVNHPPVSSIDSCAIRYAVDSTVTVDPDHIYINNQKGYLEIGREAQNLFEQVGLMSLAETQVEITYVSNASVPKPIKLATGYQTGHMINAGFVDKNLPPNFGKVDIGGLTINNKKGSKSHEEMRSSSFSPDAERILTPYRRLVAA